MKKIPIKKMESNRIELRPFSINYVSKEYLEWMNDKDITKFINKAKDKTSLEDLELFSKNMINSNFDYFFAIIFKDENCHIGNVRLGPVDFNLMSSNFGILIGDKNFHGLGLATEVLELIKDFGFNYLNLKTIRFAVVKEHSAAMRLYAKTKFKYLGETKKTFDKNGVSWKLVEWSMSNLNYEKNKNE
ncbi:GNAT family N-acetyltransferase [Candidatus Pelagibacter sp. HIMB1495]|uniref:GNAT family N-acetyltransferase n=1 Tax=unclassified Candidatus Pelagibacter TaxID=2647897 RepID=UPI003F8695B8